MIAVLGRDLARWRERGSTNTLHSASIDTNGEYEYESIDTNTNGMNGGG